MPCILGILEAIPMKPNNNTKQKWRVEVFDAKDGLWKWCDIFSVKVIAEYDASQKRDQGHRTRITKYFDWQQTSGSS